MKVKACFHMELWFFEVIKLDVCGRLVLSNSVTYASEILSKDYAVAYIARAYYIFHKCSYILSIHVAITFEAS